MCKVGSLLAGYYSNGSYLKCSGQFNLSFLHGLIFRHDPAAKLAIYFNLASDQWVYITFRDNEVLFINCGRMNCILNVQIRDY